MALTDIRLQSFRNHKDSSFELDEGVNIIVGPNGAGKTSLLEAMLMISSGKTYRSADNLVKHSQDWARIDAHTDENSQRTIKMFHKVSAKAVEFEIDKKIYKRLPAAQTMPVVVFEPNHLFLLQGEPSGRRAYLDDIIEQNDIGYSKARRDFKRSLAQRNRLLKESLQNKTSVFAWNIRFVEAATKIREGRDKLINEINKNLAETYNHISKDKTKLKIEYTSNLADENYSTSLLNKLEENYETDVLRGFTSAGPQRDDLIFIDNEKEFASSGSRGEIRTLILALKSIELELLEKKTGKKSLFLLDDVFSELDGSRRKALTSLLKNRQAIITTTDADIITKNFSQKSHIIVLS
jgi:DNA replication and repair protein RecF